LAQRLYPPTIDSSEVSDVLGSMVVGSRSVAAGEDPNTTVILPPDVLGFTSADSC
jgi:hypothetical protein